MTGLSFRSPLRKLVVFFRDSRDKWKKKCQEAKHELKLLKRRYGTLQKNHDRWQQQCRQVEAQCQQLQTQVELSSQERVALS